MQTEFKETFEAYQTEKSSYLGLIEFEDNEGEWYDFEIYKSESFLSFGSHCNAGFLISGFIERDSYESLDETLQELLEDLKVYYNDGPEHVSRIKCNNRM
jgi:hypothetical protein